MSRQINAFRGQLMLTFALFWLLFFMGIHAIVVAAGMGERFGGMKQFFMIKGRPLVSYTLEIFDKCRKVSDIVLVVPEKRVADMQRMVRTSGIKKPSRIVCGGKRRQDSVLKGLRAIKATQGIVIVHDGVRPTVSQELIDQGIRLCKKYKAVIFGLPITDTVKHVLAHRVLGTIPRKTLYAVQTPQFFDIKKLRDACKRVNFRKEFTDEASIVESAGEKVFLFEGETNNIKITRKRDMAFLKSLLK